MSAAKVTFVWRRDAGRSTLHRFFLGSMLVHAAALTLLLWYPSFSDRPAATADYLVVDLAPALAPAAGGSPGSVAPEALAPPPPAAEPEARIAAPQSPRDEPPPPRVEERPAPQEPTTTPPRPEAPAGDAPVGPGPGAGQPHPGPAGAGGGMIAPLEGGNDEFAWYRASVTAALFTHWRRPILSGLREPLETTVTFEILRDGSVSHARVEESSGVPSLDRSALRAVLDASPLPPLPRGWAEPRLFATFVFRLFPEEN